MSGLHGILLWEEIHSSKWELNGLVYWGRYNDARLKLTIDWISTMNYWISAHSQWAIIVLWPSHLKWTMLHVSHASFCIRARKPQIKKISLWMYVKSQISLWNVMEKRLKRWKSASSIKITMKTNSYTLSPSTLFGHSLTLGIFSDIFTHD